MEESMKTLITAVALTLLTGTSANAGTQGLLKLGSKLHDITGLECLEVLMKGVHLGSGAGASDMTLVWKVLYQDYAYGVVNRGGEIAFTTKRTIEVYDVKY